MSKISVDGDLSPHFINKRTKISGVVLTVLATAGVLSMVVLAPNAIQALEMFEGKKKRKKTNNKYRVNTALNRLIKNGSIEKVFRNGKVYFEITSTGRQKLDSLYAQSLTLERPKKWDGKWRIVSFDVYEKRRKFRDKLRYMLKSLGFVQVHQSMWVFPYDCEDLISLIKSDMGMGKNVLYIIADKMEGDNRLRKHFKLL